MKSNLTENILLVGGFGFIGKNLIEKLYGHFNIHVIGRSEDKNFINRFPNITFISYDFIKDTNIEEILLFINPEYIINLISIVTANRDLNNFKQMIDINIKVLLDLYEGSKNNKGLKFFLQFGSGEEYGNIISPFKEIDREFPSSPYALSKQLASNTAIMLYNNYSFPISVVRPGNLFGEYQDSDKFITYIIEKLSKNELVETTYCEQKRDYIYAQDFATGIKKVIDNYDKFIGEIFNLSSGESFKLKDIIEFSKKSLASKSRIEYGKIPYRENEMWDFKLDISKFKKLAQTSFDIDFYVSLSKFISKRRETLK
jgi:nucleoside-diphosphate-sugar epimerase